MKKVLFLLPLVALLGAAPLPEAKWQRLFDGKTLNGWTPKIAGRALGEDPRHMFIVENGTILVSHANYPRFEGEFGHLYYKKPFKAYRLRLEYRLFGESLPGVQVWQQSNSGVMFHTQDPKTIPLKQDFPVSLEMQFLAVPRPKQEPTGNLCTPGTIVDIDGKPIEKHCILSSSPLMPMGQWVKAEVEVLPNGQITHSIDGKAVLRYSNAELDPEFEDAKPLIAAQGGSRKLTGGYIALQSEGHPIAFRNIEILPLD